jgi:hypothetical protein
MPVESESAKAPVVSSWLLSPDPPREIRSSASLPHWREDDPTQTGGPDVGKMKNDVTNRGI